MKKTDKNYKYRDILTATDCAIANEVDLRYNDSMNKQKNKTFNVCYLREYMDPDQQGEFFYGYDTIYRNVPEKYRSKFDTKEMLRIIKNCSEKEKALLLAEACGIVAADGVFEKSEIESLKLLITAIGANEEAARDTILKLHGIDIYNPGNDNQNNNQNNGSVMGFRSHHDDKDE